MFFPFFEKIVEIARFQGYGKLAEKSFRRSRRILESVLTQNIRCVKYFVHMLYISVYIFGA